MQRERRSGAGRWVSGLGRSADVAALASGLDSTERPLAGTATGSSRPTRNYADENSPPKADFSPAAP